MIEKYKCTIEQVEKIKKRDMESISLFISDNWEKLYKICQRFSKFYKWDKGYDADEMMATLYLDLPYCNFTSDYSFYMSLKHILSFSVCGGLHLRKEAGLQCTGNANGGSRGWSYWDVVVNDNFNYNDLVLVNEEHPDRILDDFCEKNGAVSFIDEEATTGNYEWLVRFVSPFLTTMQSQYLSLFLEGYTDEQIADYLAVKVSNIRKTKLYCFDNLTLNYHEIIRELKKHGINVDMFGTPDRYSKALERFNVRKEESKMISAKRKAARHAMKTKL